MGYKWKPSAAQRAVYAAAMREAETYQFIRSNGPIRTGDLVEFFDPNASTLVRGQIERHSYGQDQGQHTFSVRLQGGELRLIKGRNLYPRLTEHKPAASIITTTTTTQESTHV